MSATLTVCSLRDLGPGAMRLVEWGDLEILVANCDGSLHAMEDRCSHDDGPLHEGKLDPMACTVECPRHGSIFDLCSGWPLCLPAFKPVTTFPVTVEGGEVKIAVD
ncbi:MAG: non-heme iron oxygenase ferredoxin subunit [Actinobacteria bacterium]|nr:non-heme iron oxygenase ferredoxin subunit [Actinomycetota bacterium]